MPDTSMLTGSILAVDIGMKRIGVALASPIARIAAPLTTLDAEQDFIEALRQLITEQSVGTLVAGMPRNLSGQDTAQTASVQAVVTSLQSLGLPVYVQDEAVTSRQAEAELIARDKPYAKGDIDALAATYILEDFLNNKHPERV